MQKKKKKVKWLKPVHKLIHKLEIIAFLMMKNGYSSSEIRHRVKYVESSIHCRYIEYDIYSNTVLFNFFNYDLDKIAGIKLKNRKIEKHKRKDIKKLLK